MKKEMMKKRKFVAITGTDGSGKATQLKLLSSHLKRKGYRVSTIDFPGYQRNFFGKVVGKYLRGEFGKASEVSPYLASMLYAADRFEDAKRIRRWLSEGRIVIADRYASDNQIHQGGKIMNAAKRKEFLDWLEEMEFKIFKIPRPDAIVYLDVPLEITQKLLAEKSSQDKKDYLAGKKDIHESDSEHLINAKANAIELVKKTNKWIRINCAPDGEILLKEEITNLILKALKF
ncbi:thymidylate kinase [Candidatus Parcubacteria bacterium]|nr:MAG: thymidylate kinase [Candidatus Parcubacteria bacterium]